ncbi:hypothetical protein [Breoghania sp.]|uniref:hypothetical protein n=1 Tax=Breoghania sp. TaxID=2065378 RepID=UPI002AA61712|nr:hypothetical protein [Breoghania sp.]
MFNNIHGHNASDTDTRLRKNLQTFNRTSLKILHPLFRDALRLLAHRHPNSKRETMLLPLVRFSPQLQSPMTAEMPRSSRGRTFRTDPATRGNGVPLHH